MNPIILIPTYNERENITRIVPLIFSSLPDATVMVIDDNSPDGTGNEVETMQTTFPHLILYARAKKAGLGSAYMDAFQKVFNEYPGADIICTMDADLSHDPQMLPTMLEAMAECDVVIGSRYVKGGRIVGWELWRKLLSFCGNRYCRTVTRLPIRDCSSGFICMRKNILRQIDFSDFDTSGYAFLMYLKYKLWQLEARIKEVPICFTNRIQGESKLSMNIIHEGILLPWKLIGKKKR
ncbi:MAG: polyprenol monophosphomannose synthase [Patescibacteria group bacterium]